MDLDTDNRLSELAVLDIREMYTEGYSYAEIAREFDITLVTARGIILRESWKHI